MNATLPTPRPALLPFLAVLRIAGPDAASFLQGQLTHDLRLLADGRTLLAAASTPQGRVVALLRLRQGEHGIDALLPAELAEPVAARLRRFVLRARVDVRRAGDLGIAWVPGGAAAVPALAAGGEAPVWFDYAPGRQAVAAPEAVLRELVGAQLESNAPGIENAWWSADVAAGLPQVFAASSEAFVPQMLNLDLLDAISFSKGCYTGQEIVARTQHLGRIKRRTARFRLPAGPPLQPLAGLFLDGTKVAEVVLGAVAGNGDGLEVLAVTSLEAWGRTLIAEDGREAVPQALPYAVATNA
jgi:folate-binding protein YgfZ